MFRDDKNSTSTSPSNVDLTNKQVGFFSGLFDNSNPNSLLERDPEMEQIHNPFASSSSSNPFSSSSSNDQVNFIAEGSTNYEEYIVAPTPASDHVGKIWNGIIDGVGSYIGVDEDVGVDVGEDVSVGTTMMLILLLVLKQR